MDGNYPATAFLDQPELLGPRLSPDGTHVAFLSNETGRRELSVIETTGDSDPHRLTDGDLRGWAHPTDYCWGLGGDRLFVLRAPNDDWDKSTIVDLSMNREQKRLLDGAYLRFPYGLTSDGDILITRGDDGNGVLAYDLTKNTPLASADIGRPWGPAIGPNDQYVAFDATSPDQERAPMNDNFLLNLETDTVERYAVDGMDRGTQFITWAEDGRVFIRDHTDNRYGFHDLTTDETFWTAEAEPADDCIGLLNGDPVVIRNDRLAVLDDDKQVLPPKNVSEADIVDDQIAYVTTATADNPPELGIWEAESGRRTLVRLEYGLISPADYTPATEDTYEPSSTDQATARVHHPAEEPAPAVALVYSPGSEPYDGFERWVQYVVHCGYAVVRPAVPGEAFTDEALDDIAAVGDWLRAQSWVDGDRIAVMGHSSGGRDVYLQLFRRPNVWRAGFSRGGVSDVFSHDDYSDERWDLHAQMGDPEQNEETWRAQNPIEHIAGLEQPLRIHHGVHDRRVPIEQSRDLREELRDAGYVEHVDFEYEELPDNGHITADIEQNVCELAQLVDFLDRRL